MLIFGYNDKEISKWPWLVVLISNVLAAITTTYFATHIAMNDLYWLHLFNCIVVMSWFFNFFMCGIQNPGECVDNIRNSASKSQGKGDIEMERLLDDAEKGKQSDVVDYSFEAAANAISKTISSHTVHEENMPSVCYTCKLRKPLRSKHCKVQRCCIHKFDHFCPFVGKIWLILYLNGILVILSTDLCSCRKYYWA